MYRHTGRIAAAILVWLASLVWVGALLPRLTIGSTMLFFWLVGASGVLIIGVLIVTWQKSAEDSQDIPRGSGKHSRVNTSNRRMSIVERIVPYTAVLVGLPWILVPGIRSGGTPTFLMYNDMVWNTAQSIMIHEAGGVAPLENPAPMTVLIYAFSYGPSSDPSLRTVFITQFVVLVVTMILASVVPSMHVARTMERAPAAYRVILSMAIGWLPFTGPVLGQVLDFGYANVPTTYLILAFTWIVFAELRSPTLRVAVLGFATTVSLASWGPLVVVPLSLGVASLPSLWADRPWRYGAQSLTRSAWKRWVPYLVMIVSVVQMVAYGMFVVMPDMQTSGSALSVASDNVLNISMSGIAVVSSLYLVVLTLYFSSMKGRPDRYIVSGGAALALIASVAGLAVLAFAAYRAYGVFHGYYAIKFASFIFSVLVVISMTLVGQTISHLKKPWHRIGAATLALLVMGTSIFLSFGDRVLGPTRDSAYFRVISTINPMVIARHDTHDPLVDDLVTAFDATYPNPGLFLYRYVSEGDLDPNRWFNNSADPDSYVDRYMIQLSTIHDETNRDEIRLLAYGFPMASPEWVCQLIGLWGDDRPITVFTSPEYEERAIESVAQCSDGVTVTTDLTWEAE